MEVDALHDLVKQESPRLIFLSETKCYDFEMRRIQQRLRFKNGLFVNPRGRARGLALLWTDDVNATLRKMHERCIDVSITEEDRWCWRLTRIYGWAEHGQKWRTWELMRDLGQQWEEKWLMFWDFNEILLESKKKGGNPGYGGTGYEYTWTNRREEEKLIEEKIDRAMTTGGWLNAFQDAMVVNTVWDGSDHILIILYFEQQNVGGKPPKEAEVFSF
ncbi:4-hydroxyphenylpyruvate dioxygenase [Bienertia sinuspersici]